MSTAQSLINASLRKIGALASGETPSGEESSDAFDTLNRMLESWRLEGMSAFATTEISQAISSAQTTIGTGGTINTTRPVQIENAFWVDGDVTFDLDIVTASEFNRLSQPASTGTPEVLYYDSAYPLATINLYPTPTSGTLKAQVRTPLTAFALLGSTVTLPPGYERALVYSLAVELAPDFGMEASPTVVAIARDAKADIQRNNIRMQSVMDLPNGYGAFNNRRSDIFAGE